VLSGIAALLGASFRAEAAEGTATPVAPDSAAAAILHDLRNLAVTGRVLHIGAHPDDENTQLITYLSRGRGYDTAYLSITRGDGGQNLLGPEFDEKLGVARTQELLAARRIDGGRQFFTRAIDFGFSKTPEETLSIWNHQEVLGDVVRVIRRFRPDILVTRFPVPPGSGGHGHHTASAILALEAFKLAGDPKAYPEQLKEGLTPWQPKRILWNGSGFSRGGGIEANPTVKVDIGGADPITGEAFSAIAARSRAMHKTQGMGDARSRDNGGPRLESFILLGGDPAKSDIMDGVDPTWARVAGAQDVGQLVGDVLAHFEPKTPEASVPALLAIRRKLVGLPGSPIVDDKRAVLDRVLQRCLGLEVASWGPKALLVPGETVAIRASVSRIGSNGVTWVAVEGGGHRVDLNTPLRPAGDTSHEATYTVPANHAVTQPYWLRRAPETGMYRVDDPALIGTPENPPDLPVTYTFRVEDQELKITDALAYEGRPATPPLRVAIGPPVIVRFGPGAAVFRPGTTAIVKLELVASVTNASGTVGLDVPDGWRVSPPQRFSIPAALGQAAFAFQVTAPNAGTTGTIGAHATIAGRTWNYDSVEIRYPHLPVLLLQPTARKKVVSVDVETRGRAIGYIVGAGDDVPEALEQLGYAVTPLQETDLTLDRLKKFDAVVVGVRAFNTRKDLPPHLRTLFDYVDQGGTVVCQYNRPNGLLTPDVAPYRLKLSDLRTTDETAKVTVLAPQHAVMNSPNKITAADFEGWVQERGTYYPSEWDEHFTPILELADPGEAPVKGALLVAQQGKGWFVYTGLAFFRQLPAGVPGAYRLFANLVSLGK
jgi:LmbE family N-acetylglucosaminyl deacetylase